MEVLAAPREAGDNQEQITLSNQYVQLIVSKNTGGYTLKTLAGDVLTKTDDNKQLLYQGSGGDSSFTTLRVDGRNYIYGSIKNGGEFLVRPYVQNNQVISTWRQDDITVTQTLTLLTDSGEDLLGTVKAEYLIVNTGNRELQVGARMVLDTMLGAQD